ncbi:hypothetical protein [Brevundimonas sp.]|uniref:hypothetical protein n=1 Tax=Brevundimonas sp. TaxID=1871086 RepID=UPI002C341711|nr:hypothetical protein [Brevundimonas sp.]HWQ85743.1 hypothetical protein [Brevundimonas sp.]
MDRTLTGFGLFLTGALALVVCILWARRLNRALHRRNKTPGTSFEPNLDPDDRFQFYQIWWRLLIARLPGDRPRLRREVMGFRCLQLAAIITLIGAFAIMPAA